MFSDRARVERIGRSYYALLVAFTNACFVLAFCTDVIYVFSLSVLWETSSVWLLTVGLIVGAFAVLAGLVDLWRSRTMRIPAQPWLAVVLQFVVFAAALANVFVHSRDGYTAVVPEGIILSGVTVLVLIGVLVLGRSRTRTRTRSYA